jgi:hypothetical protein
MYRIAATVLKFWLIKTPKALDFSTFQFLIIAFWLHIASGKKGLT